MRTLALVALLSLAGCAFAQKHPAVTAGIVAGVVGFGGCEFDNAKVSTCALIGVGAAAFLGGITGLVTLFADTEDHALPPDYSDEPPLGTIRVRTHTEAPPGLPTGTEPVTAPAPPGDAGVLAPDAAAP